MNETNFFNMIEVHKKNKETIAFLMQYKVIYKYFIKPMNGIVIKNKQMLDHQMLDFTGFAIHLLWHPSFMVPCTNHWRYLKVTLNRST